MEEVGAVELADGGHLVVNLTAGGVQLQREPGDTAPINLDLHHTRWLRNLLDRAIEKASKEGL